MDDWFHDCYILKPELFLEIYSKGTLMNLLELQRKDNEIEYLNENRKKNHYLRNCMWNEISIFM